MKAPIWGVAVVGGLIVSGCTSPCEEFNPYQTYQRVEDPLFAPDELVDIEPGVFRLAVYNTGDENLVRRALSDALEASGGGTLAELSEQDEVNNLLDFARGASGPYSNTRPRIGRYEVRFRSDDLDLSDPMEVEWLGNVNQLSFDVNAPDSPVRLIDLGQGSTGANEYQLTFAEEAELRAPGPQVVRTDSGFGFRTPQFRLVRKEDDRAVDVSDSDVFAETAEVQDPRVLLYEVRGFSGDVSALLCDLLRENRVIDDEFITTFTMRQTDIWLYADSRGGTVSSKVTVRAQAVVNNATDLPQDLRVEIEGVGSFEETDGGDIGPSGEEVGSHSLTARFEESEDRLILSFQAELDNKPDTDVVTFVFKLNDREQRVNARVEASE